MKIYLNEIVGIPDAMVTMMMSKGKWTRERELELRHMINEITNRDGSVRTDVPFDDERLIHYNDEIANLVKWGWQHITLLKFVDMSITVDGLHRAGQDDWDAHAMRYWNRIIRNSTRVPSNPGEKLSEYYEDKIIPTDMALAMLGITTPDKIERDGVTYVRAFNGYIKEGMENVQDVKRGLYMLSFPSSFIFRVSLTEFAHVYKERNDGGHAHPEVKRCCEMIADAIEEFQPEFNRELLLRIKN